MNWLWFELYSTFLYVTGMRDRLRCPSCASVGTYKPRGSGMDRWLGKDTRAVHRWLCKFCGFYRGPEKDVSKAYPSSKGQWQLEDDGTLLRTPKEALQLAYKPYTAPWPWRG